MSLNGPYRETVNLNFTFTWGNKETEDRVKVFMPPLFRGIVNKKNTETRGI